MISQSLLSELNLILKEDYKLTLSPAELLETANSLVGIFELLAKMNIDSDYENKKYAE
jgi:hypothetical protein